MERVARFPLLDGFDDILVIVEPDAGGEAVKKWLSQSVIRHRAKLLTLPLKDPSALYLDSPKRYLERWRVACLGAMPWTSGGRSQCRRTFRGIEPFETLAKKPDILGAFGGELRRGGFAGDDKPAQIAYLALNLALLQAGGAGDQRTVERRQMLHAGKRAAFLPAIRLYACRRFVGTLARLQYRPLRHRHLILYEASGLGPFATYLLARCSAKGI